VTRGRPFYLFESLVFFRFERTVRIKSLTLSTEYMVGYFLDLFGFGFEILFLFLQGLLRRFKVSSVCTVNFW
jgi:hypothetical protein